MGKSSRAKKERKQNKAKSKHENPFKKTSSLSWFRNRLKMFLFVTLFGGLVVIFLQEFILVQIDKHCCTPQITIKPTALLLNKSSKKYRILIQNNNKESVLIETLNIEFYLSNNIKDIKKVPLILNGGVSSGGFEIARNNKDGTKTIVSEEDPMEDPLSKQCDFVPQKHRNENKSFKSNKLLFRCNDWGTEVAFIGGIIVDLSTKPMLNGMIGNYKGTFTYQIRGKKFRKEITGTIQPTS